VSKFYAVSISLDGATHDMARMLVEAEAQSLSAMVRTFIRERYAKLEAECDPDPKPSRPPRTTSVSPQPSPEPPSPNSPVKSVAQWMSQIKW
jgi:hypothetical protein